MMQMTAMLAFHGFSKGTFVGHSYGTSWLSYMCKYAPGAVASLLFLDPICFCLHNPRLTTSFVYHRPDPGTIAFTIRTDMMVNWTIQRAFPWAWISLFLDQVHVPCTIFLGDKDALVPSDKLEEYLQANNIPIADAATVTKSFFDDKGDIKACVWRGGYHGIFTDTPHLVHDIAVACASLGNRVEERESR
jgi:pimeloyl-ACP methyl ester carboxylesterase